MAVKASKTDPFETAPEQNDTAGDEAQADIDSAGVIRPKENPLIVPVSNEGKVTVTLKGGTGFNAPWVVIHGKDVSDALNQINDTQLAELLERAQKASKFFADKAEAPAPAASQAGSQAQGGQPQASTQSSGNDKFCKHGQMVSKSGVSAKNGKAWSGYFCPAPKGTPDQCDPQFNR
jgi:hypothetical protein